MKINKMNLFKKISNNLINTVRKVFLIDRVRFILKVYPRWSKFIDNKGLYLCLLDVLLKREKVRKITVDGNKVYVRTNTPDLEVAISSLGEKEYDGIRASNPEYIIDAGANIGTSAIFFAKKYPKSIILAIEPEESNFELLIKNTGSIDNIKAIKSALWGKKGRKEISNRFTGHWGYTIAETENKTELVGQEIDCLTIEMLITKYKIAKIGLLKIDIEGGEKNLFENSSGWIDNVEIIAVELHDRISFGCSRAFYLATKNFITFEMHGEKVTAYKD